MADTTATIEGGDRAIHDFMLDNMTEGELAVLVLLLVVRSRQMFVRLLSDEIGIVELLVTTQLPQLRQVRRNRVSQQKNFPSAGRRLDNSSDPCVYIL